MLLDPPSTAVILTANTRTEPRPVAKSRASQEPIGDTIRRQRVEVLGRGLREMAALLDIAPAHLTDIEKGRRTPSEELLTRIAEKYQMDAATLRSGWLRPEADVARVASKTPTTAAKAPVFMRAAENLSAEQWDSLIEQARRMATGRKGKSK